MNKLLSEMLIISTKSAITYMIHGRVSLDYIKSSDLWMLTTQTQTKFISPRNASKLVRSMKNVGQV